jgi:hypothetical protein
MKKTTHHLIAEVPLRQSRIGMTIGIDLGDVWSHYCTLNEDGEVVDRGRFRTTPKAIEKWFTDVPHARVAMEAGMGASWADRCRAQAPARESACRMFANVCKQCMVQLPAFPSSISRVEVAVPRWKSL